MVATAKLKRKTRKLSRKRKQKGGAVITSLDNWMENFHKFASKHYLSNSYTLSALQQPELTPEHLQRQQSGNHTEFLHNTGWELNQNFEPADIRKIMTGIDLSLQSKDGNYKTTILSDKFESILTQIDDSTGLSETINIYVRPELEQRYKDWLSNHSFSEQPNGPSIFWTALVNLSDNDPTPVLKRAPFEQEAQAT